MVAFLMELPRREGRGAAAASVLVHAALISGAVIATIQTRAAPANPHPSVPLLWMVPPTRAPAPPPAGLGPLVTPPAPQPFAVPATVPTVIPPPPTTPFDPSRFGLEPVGPAAVAPAPVETGAPGAIYADRWVEEPPVLVSHPPARFPDVLRQAGIGGRAVVEAVIDTTGRAEPGSLAVLEATNQLFEAPARAVVAGSVYRPGRVSGRPVRVRVRVAVVFRLEGGDARM